MHWMKTSNFDITDVIMDVIHPNFAIVDVIIIT